MLRSLLVGGLGGSGSKALSFSSNNLIRTRGISHRGKQVSSEASGSGRARMRLVFSSSRRAKMSLRFLSSSASTRLCQIFKTSTRQDPYSRCISVQILPSPPSPQPLTEQPWRRYIRGMQLLKSYLFELNRDIN